MQPPRPGSRNRRAPHMSTSIEDINVMVSPGLGKVSKRKAENRRLGSDSVPEWVTWRTICGSLWTMQCLPAHFGPLCFENRNCDPVAGERGTPECDPKSARHGEYGHRVPPSKQATKTVQKGRCRVSLPKAQPSQNPHGSSFLTCAPELQKGFPGSVKSMRVVYNLNLKWVTWP